MPSPFRFSLSALHGVLRPLLLATFALLSVGCDEPDAEEIIKKESTFAEQHKEATVFFNVDDDGEAQVVVKSPDGVLLTSELEGQLFVETEGKAKPVAVALEAHPERGVYTAKVAELDVPVTTLRYELKVKGRKIEGALFLPSEGTLGLAKAAEEASSADKEKGEHGGVIQVIDGRRYEVAANAGTGEMRVYPAEKGSDEPIKLELAVDSGKAERIQLELTEDGYYSARTAIVRVPHKVTLIVTDDDKHVHLAVVGYRPHVVLAVHHAPVFWVHHKWKPRGHAYGHDKHKHKHHKHKGHGHHEHDHDDHDDHGPKYAGPKASLDRDGGREKGKKK